MRYVGQGIKEIGETTCVGVYNRCKWSISRIEVRLCSRRNRTEDVKTFRQTVEHMGDGEIFDSKEERGVEGSRKSRSRRLTRIGKV